MAETKITLAKAHSDLVEAEQAYNDATKEAELASSARTGALNRLNTAQKTLDHILEQIRAASPHGSDWHRKKHEQPRDV